MRIGKISIMKHWQFIAVLLICFDIVSVAASYFLALLLRFDFHYNEIPKDYLHEYMVTIPFYIAVVVVVFLLFKLYRSIWRSVSFVELRQLIIATCITIVIYVAGSWLIVGRMPISYYIFGIVLQFCLTTGIRFSYRFVRLLSRRSSVVKSESRVMIVGAGESGAMILKDMKTAKETTECPVCFIDDNKNKWGRYVDGVKVVGGREKILETVQKESINKIYVAIPSATAQEKKEILDICKNTGCELKNLPGAYQLRTGEITVSAMKDVDVEDLLGREPVKLNKEKVYEFIEGKVILVTGGGGSIGSELCRQIAAHNPKHLIIFDIYENNAYDIQLELRRNFPYLKLDVIIGSVRDSRKLWSLFETYKPDVVYHAAAHKHVPLMEDSPCEAIKNNVIGTYKTAYAAMVNHVKKFVLISTDKAVNPTNIMGASKRMCEMVIQSFNGKIIEGKAGDIPQIFTHGMVDLTASEEAKEALKTACTEFVAVRFGNVLGSNGSVIPLFKKQIAEGGPVTVTHPDIIRYFMTIPEAVSLVMEAGTFAEGGEIMVLDMGEPVKIVDMARNLIRLSGHTPDGDIKIVFTGLRPGEKLYEEKLMAEEGLKDTPNKMIYVGLPIDFDHDEFLKELVHLQEESYKNVDNIRELVQRVVNTYHPA